jgi:hypothetical protein
MKRPVPIGAGLFARAAKALPDPNTPKYILQIGNILS